MCNFEEDNSYPVKIICRVRNVQEVVVFHPLDLGNGKLRLLDCRFGGCEIGFSKCPECDACREEAWQKVLEFNRR